MSSCRLRQHPLTTQPASQTYKPKKLLTFDFASASRLSDILPLRARTLCWEMTRAWWTHSEIFCPWNSNGKYPATSLIFVESGTIRARTEPTTWMTSAGRVNEIPLPSISLPTFTPHEIQRTSPARIFGRWGASLSLFLTIFQESKSLKYIWECFYGPLARSVDA